MPDSSALFDQLPPASGVGYKPQHFSAIMADASPVEWLEIHAENYVGAGGRPLAQLRALAERFPISVHGVGLSIGGEGRLDPDHLARSDAVIEESPVAAFHGPKVISCLVIADPIPICALVRDEIVPGVGLGFLFDQPVSYL